MAQPLAPGSIVLFTVRYSLASQTMLTTIVTRWSGTVAAPDYTTVLNDVLATQDAPGGFLSFLDDVLSEQCVITRFDAQPLFPTRLATVVRNMTRPGTLADPSVPTNTALTLTKRSEIATRFGRGSMHIPGIPMSSLTGPGSWSGAILGFANAMAARLMAGLDGVVPGTALFFPVLWSAKTPLRVTSVTSIVAEVTPRTMYRRTVGVGI